MGNFASSKAWAQMNAVAKSLILPIIRQQLGLIRLHG